MTLRTTAWWWALLLLAGCGGKYGRTVPDDMVNKLTYEDKVDLVEAENDLFVAYDRVDDAENEILRTRDQIPPGEEVGVARRRRDWPGEGPRHQGAGGARPR